MLIYLPPSDAQPWIPYNISFVFVFDRTYFTAAQQLKITHREIMPVITCNPI